MYNANEMSFENGIDTIKELTKRLVLYTDMAESAGINKVRSSIVDTMINIAMRITNLCGDLKQDVDCYDGLAS
jgi:hypothetical protein